MKPLIREAIECKSSVKPLGVLLTGIKHDCTVDGRLVNDGVSVQDIGVVLNTMFI
jgi:hypothetical protein